MKFSTANPATALSNKMVESLGGYLDNLAGAVTNGGSKFEQYSENFMKLSNSIVTMMDTNKKEQAELQDLREENANLKKKVVVPDAGGGKLQSTPSDVDFPGCGPKQFWVRGAYCWSHGSSFGKRHNSGNYRDKKTGHQIEATCENTMGGTQDNKNWDA